jgi:bleomycin hydrolase
MDKGITLKNIEAFDEDFHASRANLIAMNAVTANGVAAAAKRWDARKDERHVFSLRLDNKGITNQASSGRCWMFAALNCLRAAVIRNLELEDFELSQNYLFFYDKLEKANYLLESILTTFDEPVDGRLITHLLDDPMQDGGQWDMICALIEKYGVVPKDAMPESKCSSNSDEMCGIINEKLREDACILRREHESGKSPEALRTQKKEMLAVIYRMLAVCLGNPPETFDFQVRSKSGTFVSEKGIAPLEFYRKYVNVDVSQYISLIHAPTDDKPFMKSYTVRYLGNVVGGKEVRYVNLPIEELKKAAIAQMRSGEPVWFGSDVGQMFKDDEGVMDLNAYDFASLFGTDFNMTKADRLDYGHSMMTHAMVFQGVDLDGEQPVRWCVENSWGDDTGKKGMFLLTDAWFDQYVYQIVVNKRFLSEEILRAYEGDPIALAPWDPMGSLA